MDYQQFLNTAGYSGMSGGFVVLFAILAIWDLVWRGIALWKAAENKSKPWFVCLLIFNTFGILPIIYIFYFAKKKVNKIA